MCIKRSGMIYIVIFFLVVVSALYIREKFFVFHAPENPYPLIDFSRNFIDQKYFFTSIEPLRVRMKEIVAAYEKKGTRIGVYFEFLNTGANISINQDERFWPASLSKMTTVFAVMKKIENGEWTPSNEMVLFYDDQDDRFGELYKKNPGTTFTIEELLKETLIHSDNTAHRILVRNLESKDYTDIFQALGVEELYDKNYDITAKEYSRIFRALYNASYLNRKHSQQILTWLSESPFDELLGSGIPDEVIFSHKIGEEYEEVVYLDSGIAYVPYRPYLITVMVDIKKGGTKENAEKIMGELSKEAYEYVEGIGK